MFFLFFFRDEAKDKSIMELTETIAKLEKTILENDHQLHLETQRYKLIEEDQNYRLKLIESLQNDVASKNRIILKYQQESRSINKNFHELLDSFHNNSDHDTSLGFGPCDLTLIDIDEEDGQSLLSDVEFVDMESYSQNSTSVITAVRNEIGTFQRKRNHDKTRLETNLQQLKTENLRLKQEFQKSQTIWNEKLKILDLDLQEKKFEIQNFRQRESSHQLEISDLNHKLFSLESKNQQSQRSLEKIRQNEKLLQEEIKSLQKQLQSLNNSIPIVEDSLKV